MFCWFWKCGRLLFCGKISLWAISRDILRGSKSWCPLKISLEMTHKVICPKTKKVSKIFKISGTLGIFMSHCDQVPTTLNLLHLHIKLSPYIYTAGLKWILNFDCWQIYNFADFSRSPKILSQKVRIQGYGFWSYQLHTLVHNSTSLYTTVRRGRFDYNIFCISNYTTTVPLVSLCSTCQREKV